MVHAFCYIVLCKTSKWVVGDAFHRGQSLGGGGQCDTCELYVPVRHQTNMDLEFRDENRLKIKNVIHLHIYMTVSNEDGGNV